MPKEITLVIVAGLGLIVLMVVGLNYTDKRSCNAIEKRGTPSEYLGLIEGCYVEVNGKLIPRDNWRGEYER